MSVRLTDDEAWDVLERSHTGILTTLRRDGVPISLPVWYIALDRHVYITGPSRTKKFGRLRHDSRVSFLVESGIRWAELIGVHLTGTAGVVEDPALLERVAISLSLKYSRFRTPRERMPDSTRAHYQTTTSTIAITPDQRILSWDNSRPFADELG